MVEKKLFTAYATASATTAPATTYLLSMLGACWKSQYDSSVARLNRNALEGATVHLRTRSDVQKSQKVTSIAVVVSNQKSKNDHKKRNKPQWKITKKFAEVCGQHRWHSLHFSSLHLIHHLHLPDGDESSESHGLCIPPGSVGTPWFTPKPLPMSWTCNLNLDIPWGCLVLLLNICFMMFYVSTLLPLHSLTVIPWTMQWINQHSAVISSCAAVSGSCSLMSGYFFRHSWPRMWNVDTMAW